MKLGAEWGKYTWIFFHCLAEKIKPDLFMKIKYKLIEWIKMICYILPCPYCSEHATQLLERYKYYNKITTKDDFKNFLFTFHNMVNKKIDKKIPDISILKQYESYNFRTATADWYNNFTVNQIDVKLSFDKTKRNQTRNHVLNQITEWINYFNI